MSGGDDTQECLELLLDASGTLTTTVVRSPDAALGGPAFDVPAGGDVEACSRVSDVPPNSAD